jgi:hypothetical protein
VSTEPSKRVLDAASLPKPSLSAETFERQPWRPVAASGTTPASMDGRAERTVARRDARPAQRQLHLRILATKAPS